MEGRFQGQADFPLTDNGRAQASALAEHWRDEAVSFEHVFSSPLLRARETAEIIVDVLSVPLVFDPELAEIDNGLLSGLTHEEGSQAAPRPAFMTPYSHFGRTGESRWELYLRAGRCIQRFVDLAPARYLVVSHGGILNMMMYAALNIPPQADFSGPRFMFHNTTYATLVYEADQHSWQLVNFDSRRHWQEKELGE